MAKGFLWTIKFMARLFYRENRKVPLFYAIIYAKTPAIRRFGDCLKGPKIAAL
jgi:hypothetical protein